MKFMNELAVEDAKAPAHAARLCRPAWREKLRSEVTPLFQAGGIAPVIAWAPSAKELGSSRSPSRAQARKDPVDLASTSPRQRSAGPLPHGRHELRRKGKKNLRLITDPHTIIALSDAGAHASQICDACYSTYLLATGARQEKTFTVEQAVHNLSANGRPKCSHHRPRPAGQGRPPTSCVDPKTVAGPLSGLRMPARRPSSREPAASTPSSVKRQADPPRRQDAIADNDKLRTLLRHGELRKWRTKVRVEKGVNPERTRTFNGQ